MALGAALVILYVSLCPEKPKASEDQEARKGVGVENEGMVLVGARALKESPSPRFNPSPLPWNALGPVTTLANHRIRKSGRGAHARNIGCRGAFWEGPCS